MDELEKTDLDNDTIGLLLCKDADSFVAKTSLKKNKLPLGISKYKFIEELPEYLERKLKGTKVKNKFFTFKAIRPFFWYNSIGDTYVRYYEWNKM